MSADHEGEWREYGGDYSKDLHQLVLLNGGWEKNVQKGWLTIFSGLSTLFRGGPVRQPGMAMRLSISGAEARFFITEWSHDIIKTHFKNDIREERHMYTLEQYRESVDSIRERLGGRQPEILMLSLIHI